jgi:outer membrane biosynthesis protein TonB
LSEKPQISEDSYNLYDEEFISSLIDHIASLSSIYHKTPEDLAAIQKKSMPTPVPKKEDDKKEEAPAEEKKGDKSPSKNKDKKKKEKEEEPVEDKKSKSKESDKAKKSPDPKKSKTKKEPEVSNFKPSSSMGIDIDDLLGFGDSSSVPQQ